MEQTILLWKRKLKPSEESTIAHFVLKSYIFMFLYHSSCLNSNYFYAERTSYNMRSDNVCRWNREEVPTMKQSWHATVFSSTSNVTYILRSWAVSCYLLVWKAHSPSLYVWHTRIHSQPDENLCCECVLRYIVNFFVTCRNFFLF